MPCWARHVLIVATLPASAMAFSAAHLVHNRPLMKPKLHRSLCKPMCSLSPLAGALAADICAGGLAAFGCAPLVSCVDQAITLSASGDAKLWPTIFEKIAGIARSPAKFFTSAVFWWLWSLFAVTYAVANVAATLARACGISPTVPVLIFSTAANMAVCIAKDAAFARMLSSGEPKSVPAQSYLAWFGRDLLTMAFVFTLPMVLASRMPVLLCRLLSPVVAQCFTTPLHLLGLGFYNTPEAPLSAMRNTLLPTIIARQFRIIPAFSLGGVANARLRAILLP